MYISDAANLNAATRVIERSAIALEIGKSTGEAANRKALRLVTNTSAKGAPNSRGVNVTSDVFHAGTLRAYNRPTTCGACKCFYPSTIVNY